MSELALEFTGPLKRWTGATTANWFFVSIDGDAAEEISGLALMRRLESGRRSGFGSVKVTVTAGSSSWKTSVFPTKEKTWFLPIKKQIRKAEDLAEGEPVKLTLEI